MNKHKLQETAGIRSFGTGLAPPLGIATIDGPMVVAAVLTQTPVIGQLRL